MIMRAILPFLRLILALHGAVFCACTPGPRIVMEEIAHYDTPGWTHDVALDQDVLYVSDRQGGYLVFDRAQGWSAPRTLTPVADVISLAPNFGSPLLASRFEGLVLVAPSGNVRARLSIGEIANAVVTRGNLVYAAYGSHGLVIGRIGAGGIDIVSQLATPGWSHDIKLWRNYALIADWNYGLRVVDVAIPQGPVEIDVLPSPATAICISVAELAGRPTAAVAEGHAGVSLVALDGTGRTRLIARHALGLNPADSPHPQTGGWAHGVALCRDLLFVANWKRGLVVLDVKDPRQPRTILEVPTRGTSLGVKAETEPDGGVMVFLADGEEGLRVFHFRYP
jgi:hypothetical protein